MTVKIVTDSTSDIPPEIASSLGIAIVPAYVRFGDKVFRDRVDITADEFFQKLEESQTHPATSAPSPGDFAEVYRKLSQESDGKEGLLSAFLENNTPRIFSSLSGSQTEKQQGDTKT